MWLIADTCHELIDALPVLVADEDKDGDIIKTTSIADDIADAARYGLKSMLSPRGIPKDELLNQQLQDVRKGFAKPNAPEPKPGTDWFSQFGGAKAKRKK